MGLYRGGKMSKAEAIHELYLTCKDINFDETTDMIVKADSDDEKDFIRLITDFVLQKKQKQVVAEKRF